MVALTLGWLLFEPFILSSTELDEGSVGAVRARLRVSLGEFLRRLRAADPQPRRES